MSTWQRAQTMGDVLRANAYERPDKIAFMAPGRPSVTFAQFNRRVNRLAHSLIDSGLRTGDRVAILSPNCIEYAETFGVAKCGMVVVPLNWRLAEAELLDVIRHSDPKVLIVAPVYRDLVQSMRADLPGVILFVVLNEPGASGLAAKGDTGTGWKDYEAFLNQGGSDDEPQTSATPDDVLSIVYTSGTTGRSKGVMLTHRGVLENCRTAAIELLALTPDDFGLSVLPLFHVGGMWYHLFPSFATGGTTLLLGAFNPGEVLKILDAHPVTHVHLVPTMIGALVAHPEVATYNLNRLRLMFYGASSMPVELLRRAMRCFSGSGFVQGYGSTEAGVVSGLLPADHQRAVEHDASLLNSCGRAFSGKQVRLSGTDGTTRSEGEIGEIEVHGRGVMTGYWRDDAATADSLVDGWLKTGDLGRCDENGYLYLVDRKNDMIVTGGENVYPTEVENVLYQNTDILEAAVFGIPDPHWVEKVVAAVVLKPGASPDPQPMLARLRQQLAAYKCPKEMFVVAELPKSGAGKVLRKTLREHFTPKE